MALTLSDVAEFIVDTKHNTPKFTENGYPCIRTPNIGRGHFILDNAKYVTEETYQEWIERLEPKEEDLILAREAPVGNVAIIPPGLKVCHGQRTVLIRLDRKKANPRYIMYLLLGDEVQGKMTSMATGATVPHLNMSDIRTLKLPELPPLQAQNKIAYILSAYDDLIENNKSRIKILEEMAQAIYREWFVNFRFPGHEKAKMIKSEMGMIPEGWEVRKVGGLADFMKGRKAKNIFENAIAEAIPYLLIDGLRNRSFSYTDDPKMVIATNNDVIMVMDGASSGQVFIGYSGAVGSTLGIYRVRDSFCCSPYLLYLFMKENFKSISDRNVGSAIPHANKDYIASMSIAISSPEVMSSFQNLANSVFKQVDILERKNRNLRKTRDLLLPKLISGEVDVERLDIRSEIVNPSFQ